MCFLPSRPGKSSYLVFNKFSASILDKKLLLAEGFVSGRHAAAGPPSGYMDTRLPHAQDNNGALLREEDFVVDKETGRQPLPGAGGGVKGCIAPLRYLPQ